MPKNAYQMANGMSTDWVIRSMQPGDLAFAAASLPQEGHDRAATLELPPGFCEAAAE